MSVNVWDVVEDLKPIVVSGRVLDTRRLADPAVVLAQVVTR
jgi:3-phenylpropionate/trans-cinnamate dioxygenase ferredoxin reductase subunit